jgi:ubiquinone/menaquinone biosynthesis C-methylase UbiE
MQISNDNSLLLRGWAGDVAFRVLHAIHKAEHRAVGNLGGKSEAKNETRVHVCDINPNMLEVGKQRAHKLGDLFIPSSFCSILEE